LTTLAFLEDLQRRGILIAAHGSNLDIDGPENQLSPALIAQIRAMKPALLTALQVKGRAAPPAPPDSTSKLTSCVDVPAHIRAGVISLPTKSGRGTFSPEEWESVVTDANTFLEAWAGRALALGWSGLELFGAHQARSSKRLDGGLVPLLRGATVAMMDSEAALITRGSVATRVPRLVHPDAVLLWHLT
jgi:hypothetical protein